MICPYCGAELESGVLQAGGGRGIYWLEHRVKYRPPQQVNGAEGLIQFPYVPAFRCPACRKIICSY